MNLYKRKLGLIENLFHIIHELGGMIDVNVARVEGKVSANILQQALNCLQKLYPMLQVHIVKLADGAYFQSENTTEIPLRVIGKQDENQWLEIAEEELHQKFSIDSSPLCRVILLRSAIDDGTSEIFVTFHHAITDGTSCMNFINNLLSYYQKIAAGENIEEFTSIELLPPLEEMVNRSLINQNNLEKSEQKSVQESLNPQLIIEKEAPPSQRRTHLVNRIFSKDMTRRLKERCKQEQTTVHGGLCAAMLLGTAKIAFNNDNNKSLSLSCGSNVSLRKSCQPEVNSESIGCFISIVEEIHTIKENNEFWDLARECKSKITNSISLGTPIARICSDRLQYVNEDIIIQLSNQNMGRKNTIEISNRGRFDIPDNYGELQLKELYFATGQHWVGGCFWLGVVTFHEQLFCTFSHVVPLVSSNTAELLVDSVIDTLETALK
ncbi:MAG: condensation domain-containing protein [Cyanobacteria bacterium P01_A01_bin.68]